MNYTHKNALRKKNGSLCMDFSYLVIITLPILLLKDLTSTTIINFYRSYFLIVTFLIQKYFLLLTTSLAKELYFLQNAVGSGLAPFDCWICLRGIKTMALRVEKQQVML